MIGVRSLSEFAEAPAAVQTLRPPAPLAAAELAQPVVLVSSPHISLLHDVLPRV